MDLSIKTGTKICIIPTTEDGHGDDGTVGIPQRLLILGSGGDDPILRKDRPMKGSLAKNIAINWDSPSRSQKKPSLLSNPKNWKQGLNKLRSPNKRGRPVLTQEQKAAAKAMRKKKLNQDGHDEVTMQRIPIKLTGKESKLTKQLVHSLNRITPATVIAIDLSCIITINPNVVLKEEVDPKEANYIEYLPDYGVFLPKTTLTASFKNPDGSVTCKGCGAVFNGKTNPSKANKVIAPREYYYHCLKECVKFRRLREHRACVGCKKLFLGEDNYNYHIRAYDDCRLTENGRNPNLHPAVQKISLDPATALSCPGCRKPFDTTDLNGYKINHYFNCIKFQQLGTYRFCAKCHTFYCSPELFLIHKTTICPHIQIVEPDGENDDSGSSNQTTQ